MRKFAIIILMLFSFGVIAAEEKADSLSLKLSQSENQAQDDYALWNDANASYVACDYASAIALYRKILDQGQYSFELYNNIACSYLKIGNIGLSILYFYRALRLNPSSADANFNLEYAQSKTKDRIQTIPEFFLVRWMRGVRSSLSCGAWSILSILAFTCLLVFASMFFIATILRVRKIGFYGALISLLVFFAVTSFAISSRNCILDKQEAVVLSSAISVKSSPDKSATDLFIIHEGAFLRILNEVDDWCEVSLSDGKKGWLEKKSIEVI